jgi:hypothetical protein
MMYEKNKKKIYAILCCFNFQIKNWLIVNIAIKMTNSLNFMEKLLT